LQIKVLSFPPTLQELRTWAKNPKLANTGHAVQVSPSPNNLAKNPKLATAQLHIALHVKKTLTIGPMIV
jgi:hypothetical protein